MVAILNIPEVPKDTLLLEPQKGERPSLRSNIARLNRIEMQLDQQVELLAELDGAIKKLDQSPAKETSLHRRIDRLEAKIANCNAKRLRVTAKYEGLKQRIYDPRRLRGIIALIRSTFTRLAFPVVGHRSAATKRLITKKELLRLEEGIANCSAQLEALAASIAVSGSRHAPAPVRVEKTTKL